MSAQELEALPVSTPLATSTGVLYVPPDDGRLHGTSQPASRRSGSPAVTQDDPSVGPRADDDTSIHRQSLWDNGPSPAALQNVFNESGDCRDPEDGDPGCRGEKGYVYPFKLKLEERYPIKDPASYTEFEKRYPPDRFGEEASDNARIWKLYRDRVTERDEDQIEGWNKTLDILLIFAGLFSAVATAFIIEAYKQLQPDYTEIMTKTFIASLNGTAATELQGLSQFSRPPLARCVNTLWFLSLTLALVVALLAILAKQWLGECTSRMRRHIGSQRRWAWRHVVYHAGLEKWGMDAFVSALPLMLHLSLMLFLVGLVLFLTDLDWVIVGFVLALTVAVIVFYVGATVAPLWFGDCPTATPILDQGRRAAEFLYTYLRHRLLSTRRSVGSRLKIQSWREAGIASSSWNRPAYDEEVLLEGAPARRDATVLHWMVTSLPAVEELDTALDAVGSLDPVERKHEFHPDSKGVASDLPFEGDTLCFGPVLIAATSRFQRLCETAASSDAAAVAHSIRTCLALSITWVPDLRLPLDSKNAAWNLLHRWAAIPTHDLRFLCDKFGDFFNPYENRNLREVVLAWMDDAGPATGQTPFLLSSISLCFLCHKWITPNGANPMTSIYSTLSTSIASSASDSARRRTALNILHDAAAVYSQDSREIEPHEVRCAMSTSQQLHFRTMATIGALWNSSPDDPTGELHRILSTNFARLISTFPGVETLTLEHISYARDILGMSSRLVPGDGKVVEDLFILVENYLCQLENWSEDAGELTRWLIELKANPVSGLGEAAYLVCRLSDQSHRNIFSTSEMAVRHSLVNLLLPGTQGELSTWKTLCNRSPHGTAAYHIFHLARTLASSLTALKRRGFDVTTLVKEFLGDDRLYNLIYGGDSGFSDHVARHARELSPSWWEDTKTRLLSLAKAHDVESSNPLAEADGGVPFSMSFEVMRGFIQEVDGHDGHCQACPFDNLRWEEITVNSRKDCNSSVLAQAWHRTGRAIIEIARKGRTMFVSDAEDHELPVTVPPPVVAHASHTVLARASVTSAYDRSV